MVYTESADFKLNPDAEFEDCEFKGIDFTTLNLKSVTFINCKFANCNLANQQMINVAMKDISFEACNLIGINWCSLKRLDGLSFRDSKLNLSSFQELKLKRLQVVNCSAIDVDFSRADLTGSDFSHSHLAGANFEGAILENADFRTSREYLFDLRKARIKGAKFSLPEVVSLITVLGAKVEL